MIDEQKAKRVLLNMITNVKKWRVNWVQDDGSAFSLTDGNLDVLFYSIVGKAKEYKSGVCLPDTEIIKDMIKEVKTFWKEEVTKMHLENTEKLRKKERELNSILDRY